MVKDSKSSVVKVQIFDQRKFKRRRDQGSLGLVEIRVTDHLDLELGGHGVFSDFRISPPLHYLPMCPLAEKVQLDLKGTNDNPIVQGKLIFHLSTIITPSATSSHLADPSLALTSLPSNDPNGWVNALVDNCSVNNASVDNYSVNNYSVNNYSADNYSIDSYSVDNYSVDNYSINNDSFYAASVNNASVSELYRPSISLSRTLSSHSTSSEVSTPNMAIPTTIIPGTHLEQQQSPRNIPTRPVSSNGTSIADHPQNPPKRSAPGIVSPEQPITNAQHSLNAKEDQHGPLPEGWESGIDTLGLTYYVNHHTRCITRNRPSPNRAVDHQAQGCGTTSSSSGSLPAGWEGRYPSEGQPYYVDFNTRSTTWVDPRRQTMSPNGQGTSLRPRTVSQLDPCVVPLKHPRGMESSRTQAVTGLDNLSFDNAFEDQFDFTKAGFSRTQSVSAPDNLSFENAFEDQFDFTKAGFSRTQAATALDNLSFEDAFEDQFDFTKAGFSRTQAITGLDNLSFDNAFEDQFDFTKAEPSTPLLGVSVSSSGPSAFSPAPTRRGIVKPAITPVRDSGFENAFKPQ